MWQKNKNSQKRREEESLKKKKTKSRLQVPFFPIYYITSTYAIELCTIDTTQLPYYTYTHTHILVTQLYTFRAHISTRERVFQNSNFLPPKCGRVRIHPLYPPRKTKKEILAPTLNSVSSLFFSPPPFI